MTDIRRTAGALGLWNRELAVGVRSATKFDSLWRAACLEQDALEAEADGLPGRAARLRQSAADVILSARKRRRTRSAA